MCEGLVLAVGDIISQVKTSSGTLTYQPAAGVEIIITAVFQYNGSAHNIGIRTAAHESYAATGGVTDQLSTKIGITNTVYFHISGGSYKAGFTGIQTK